MFAALFTAAFFLLLTFKQVPIALACGAVVELAGPGGTRVYVKMQARLFDSIVAGPCIRIVMMDVSERGERVREAAGWRASLHLRCPVREASAAAPSPPQAA